MATASEIDSRVKPSLHFIRERDLSEVRRVQTQFMSNKKKASTLIWSSVAVILTVRMLFPLGVLPLLALIAVGAVYCWGRYRTLCRCPKCSVSLVPGANTWRKPAVGFSSEHCPRCLISLVIPDSEKKMRVDKY
jgi:hypothetical protein